MLQKSALDAAEVSSVYYYSKLIYGDVEFPDSY